MKDLISSGLIGLQLDAPQDRGAQNFYTVHI